MKGRLILSLGMAILLLVSGAAVACPDGYTPCGDGTLCCPK